MSSKAVTGLFVVTTLIAGGYGALQRSNVTAEIQRANEAVAARTKGDGELKTARDEIAKLQAALKGKDGDVEKAQGAAKAMDAELKAARDQLAQLQTAKAAADKAAADATAAAAAEKKAREAAEAALAEAKKPQ